MGLSAQEKESVLTDIRDKTINIDGVVDVILKRNNKNGYQNVISILVDNKHSSAKARRDILEQASYLCNEKVIYDGNAKFVSSVGMFWHNNIKVSVKPEKAQGNNSPGIKNEVMCYNLINNIIEDAKINDRQCDIYFKVLNSKKSYKLTNIVSVQHIGRSGEKADIEITCQKTDSLYNNYRISLKKNNAPYIQHINGAVKDYYVDQALNFYKSNNKLKKCKTKQKVWDGKESIILTKAKNGKNISITVPYDCYNKIDELKDNEILLISNQNYEYKIFGERFAVKVEDKELIRKSFFGNDITKDDCIIYCDFEIEHDFVYNEHSKFYEIIVTKIIKPTDKNIEDVYVVITNNGSRVYKNTKYNGIDANVAVKSRINNNVRVINIKN